MPVRGGEGRASITQQRTETLSFEQPYSEAAAAHKRDGECRECRALRNVGGEMLFQPPRPKLGLTDVQDLSSEDMAKIGCIALIELTTFYDCLGIELKQNRTLIRHKAGRESGIFGVSLVTLLENDRKILPGSRVPLVFRKVRQFKSKKYISLIRTHCLQHVVVKFHKEQHLPKVALRV
nr:rho GTPase-activating protein 28-like isoform X2 [Paramormyrops kingsleyae]